MAKKKIVALDFGHGGHDNGASGNGIVEKNINMSVGLRIKKDLERHGVKVVCPRIKDEFISLANRAVFANKNGADAFVSIHANAFGKSSAKGFEVYHYPNSTKGKKLAKAVHKAVIDAKLYTKDRGIKTAKFAVLRHTAMKAILVELGFLTNKEDARLIHDKQDAMAEAITKGILADLGIDYKKKTATDKEESDKLYRVVTGSFSDKENADKRVEQLKKDGHDSFITVKE